MQKFTCSFCNGPHALGFMHDSWNQRICRSCRDCALTFLFQSGIAMTTKHPFIAELCLGSHAVEIGEITYYNNVTQTGMKVIRDKRIVNPK